MSTRPDTKTKKERASLNELRHTVADGPPYDERILAALRSDSRAGAQALHASCMRRQKHSQAEETRLHEMLQFEREARENGFARIAGVDEAGRGPLAGPIVAAAVVLDHPVPGLDDSKRLSAEQREILFNRLHEETHSIGVRIIDAEIIDRHGIQSANYAAMAGAAAQLDPPADFLLVDGFVIQGCALPQKRIVKGDRRSQSIAAASIVAKVTRDRIMLELDEHYPGYGFARHKGYGTEEHLQAVARLGPCPAHRKSFAPIGESCETGFLF